MERLDEEDGYRALRGHVVDKAREARARYGPDVGWDDVLRLLEDRDFVRFPTGVRFDASGLLPGEFAHAEPLGEAAADGFCLFVHPCFEGREDALPLLVAYHVPSVNYLDVATRVEAELFGAHLLGLEVDEYYARLCALADGMPEGARAPEACGAAPGAGCGGGCSC